MTLVDSKGEQTTFQQDQIESIQPSAVSTMPAGLDKAIGPEDMKDLLNFLRADPKRRKRSGHH